MRLNPDYQFEFARPAYAWYKLRWPGCLLLAVLSGLVIMQYLDLTRQTAQRDLLAGQKASMLHSRQEKPSPSPAPPVFRQAVAVLSDPQQKAAERVLQQLNVRWFDLLQALESHQVKEIALLQLLPDARRGQFVLSGEAKNYQALLQYVAHLQQSPALQQVHLQKHQVNESHMQRPVSFEIQGGWQP